jgi:hypothetical protein
LSTPHRHDPRLALQVPEKPFDRYLELQAAFEAKRGWLEDRNSLRYAAVTLVTTSEDAREIAERVHARDDELAAQMGWMSQIAGSVRLLIAATLEKRGDTTEGFLEEQARVRKFFRSQRLARAEVYETLAMLILRARNESASIPEADLLRMIAIHRQMSRHQWWLTGVDDFPAAAMLVDADGTPEEIGTGVEAIYQALRRHLWRGNALQTASNILFLTRLRPDEVAARATELITALTDAGFRVGIDQYDELAMLCFLSLPAGRVVERILHYEERMKKMKGAPFWAQRFGLATSMAFIELLRTEETASVLAEVKSLLDMQQIVAAQQAAMVAAAAS